MQDPGLLELASIMTDLWDWLKKHYDIKDTDEYWDELLASADDIWFKHDKHPLCRGLLTECVKHLEREVHQ